MDCANMEIFSAPVCRLSVSAGPNSGLIQQMTAM